MNNDYYDQYIYELNKLYENDPQKAVDYLAASVVRVNTSKSLIERLGLDAKKLDIFFTIICALLSIPVAFICTEQYEFMFGIIFYLAGLMVGIFVPVFGLIFLCSHGGIGFYFMTQEVFEIIHTNPVMGDLSTPMRSYLYTIIFVYAAAILLTILHSCIPGMREKKYIKTIISVLYLTGLLLFKLIPYKIGATSLFPLFD